MGGTSHVRILRHCLHRGAAGSHNCWWPESRCGTVGSSPVPCCPKSTAYFAIVSGVFIMSAIGTQHASAGFARRSFFPCHGRTLSRHIWCSGQSLRLFIRLCSHSVFCLLASCSSGLRSLTGVKPVFLRLPDLPPLCRLIVPTRCADTMSDSSAGAGMPTNRADRQRPGWRFCPIFRCNLVVRWLTEIPGRILEPQPRNVRFRDRHLESPGSRRCA